MKRDKKKKKLEKLNLRRDNEVNGKVLKKEKVMILRIKIGLGENKGNIGRKVEKGMRKMKGKNIEIVGKSERDNNVRLVRKWGRKKIGMWEMEYKKEKIKSIEKDIDIKWGCINEG